jgi:hypothetical protein
LIDVNSSAEVDEMQGKSKNPSKKRRPGRPEKEGGARDEKLFVRLHPDEARDLQELAQLAGVSVATLVRDVALRHARWRLERIKVICSALEDAEALAAVKGHRLNQKAKLTRELLGLRRNAEILAAQSGDSPPGMAGEDRHRGEKPGDGTMAMLEDVLNQLRRDYGASVLSMGEIGAAPAAPKKGSKS